MERSRSPEQAAFNVGSATSIKLKNTISATASRQQHRADRLEWHRSDGNVTTTGGTFSANRIAMSIVLALSL
jgi:hypothetical protein